MRSEQIAEVEVRVITKTERAVLVTDCDDEAETTWLPLAQIELTATSKPNIYVASMPEWLAQDRGLI